MKIQIHPDFDLIVEEASGLLSVNLKNLNTGREKPLGKFTKQQLKIFLETIILKEKTNL